MKRTLLFIISLFIVIVSFGAAYKWVDEEGRVHYTDTPPDKQIKQEVEIKPGPTPEEVERAQQKLKKIRNKSHGSKKEDPKDPEQRALKKLGPRPSNVSSEYLQTTYTDISYDWDEVMIARFAIEVRIKKPLPKGEAYVAAFFHNPSNPRSPLVVETIVREYQKELFFLSPPVRGLKCYNYKVIIKVCHLEGCGTGKYDSRQKLYSTHRQYIQSRVDMDSVKSRNEMLKAVYVEGGYCP